jgi:hypothetical protein
MAVQDCPSRCASVVTQLDTRLYCYGVANVSDAPNITDWLQGIGAVLAFAVTGVGLLWEIRSRRLEGADRDRARARSVVAVIDDAEGPLEDGEVRFGVERATITVTNFSPEPITNVMIILPTGSNSGRVWPSFVPSIGPGKEFVAEWELGEPFSYRSGDRPEIVDTKVEDIAVDFQIAGRRWVRVGHAEPELWRKNQRSSTEVV